MISLNILDYSPVDEGSEPRKALQQTTALAKHAEDLGFKRFWVSEHHHIPSLAGSTPEMLMMHLAANTHKIRIGSGGVMLPNYSPYKVAENFNMLEALYPNRIDLGIGSATGANRLATKALQLEKPKAEHEQQVSELLGFLSGTLPEEHPFKKLTVTPRVNSLPEIWLLGGGGKSAEIAAAQGTAFTFAHFARPAEGQEAVQSYRNSFRPSRWLTKPKVMVAVFVIVAETTEEAEQLAKAFDLWLLFIESLHSPPYYPSVETALRRGTSGREQEKATRNRQRVLVGNAQEVKAEIEQLAVNYGADEVLLMPAIAGEDNRQQALRLLAEAFRLSGN